MGGSALTSHVREIRRERRFTQSELATEIGVSRQTVIALEGDGYAPSVIVALNIARVLDCRVEDLFSLPSDPDHDDAPNDEAPNDRTVHDSSDRSPTTAP